MMCPMSYNLGWQQWGLRVCWRCLRGCPLPADGLQPRVATMALQGVLGSVLATQRQINRLAILANLGRKWVIAEGVLGTKEGVLVETAILASHFTTCNHHLEDHGKPTVLSEDKCLGGYLGNLDSWMCGPSYKLHFTICDDRLKTSSLSQSAVKGSHKASQRRNQQLSELCKAPES